MSDIGQDKKRDRFDFKGGTIEKWQISEYIDKTIKEYCESYKIEVNHVNFGNFMMSDGENFIRAVHIGRISALRMLKFEISQNFMGLSAEEFDAMPLSGYWH